MKTQHIDHMVMLLSTDWFFGQWSCLGLHAEPTTRGKLQQACREIVPQILEGVLSRTAVSYFNTNFTDERASETYRLFLSAISESGADTSFIRKASVLAEGGSGSMLETEQNNLLCTIAEGLVVTGSKQPQLKPHMLLLVSEVWKTLRNDESDLEALNLRSDSQWDLYIRSLTPGMPTYLSDWVCRTLDETMDFERFWHIVADKLFPTERVQLVDWFASEAEEIAGREVTLPDWMK